MRTRLCALALCLALTPSVARAQDDPSTGATQLPNDQVVVLTYNNRPITTIRARLLTRMPSDRVAGAIRVLDDIVGHGVTGPVAARRLGMSVVLVVNDRPIIMLTPADVDELAAETLEGKTQLAVTALRQALEEAAELRRPRQMIVSSLLALAATVVFIAVLVLLARLQRRVVVRAVAMAEHQLGRLPHVNKAVLPHEHLLEGVRRLVKVLAFIARVLLTFLWLTFVLRRFPYTRPWGESLREVLLSRISTLSQDMIHALPGVFMALLILALARFIVRVTNHVFDAIAVGRIPASDVWVETAQPTKRIVAGFVWAFALIQAYPYIPGSGTRAFEGISVLVGLMVSLGATGVIAQIMSSFMLTYTRTVRVGEFVKIGDVEGTVTRLGVMSAKLKTARGEEVSVPNAVILSDMTINYSRYAEKDGVYVETQVTIGYDVPWRQVHALLQLAADRTAGIRRRPEPVVRQKSLEDFYVRYALWISLEHATQRPVVLNNLHANILDLFNEFGVQIMSPNYEADPDTPKVVSKDRWRIAPVEGDHG